MFHGVNRVSLRGFIVGESVVFVRDLGLEVDDITLHQTFQNRYPSDKVQEL